MGTGAGQSPPGDTGTAFGPARRWGETDSRRPSGSPCDRARTRPLLDRRRFCAIRRFAMGESIEPIVRLQRKIRANFSSPNPYVWVKFDHDVDIAAGLHLSARIGMNFQYAHTPEAAQPLTAGCNTAWIASARLVTSVSGRGA